jgi:cytochrome c
MTMNANAARLMFVIAAMFVLAGCSGQEGVNGVPEPRSYSDASVESGRRLLATYGCGSCHSIPGVPGAHSMAGPPLDHFYERIYIAGRLPNTQENLVQWIQDPQKVWPGNAMPDVGVKEQDAKDMAAFLYHYQPSWTTWLGR